MLIILAPILYKIFYECWRKQKILLRISGIEMDSSLFFHGVRSVTHVFYNQVLRFSSIKILLHFGRIK